MSWGLKIDLVKRELGFVGVEPKLNLSVLNSSQPNVQIHAVIEPVAVPHKTSTSRALHHISIWHTSHTPSMHALL